MAITEQETRVLGRVLEMLGSGQALAQDLEDYVVGYQILGNLVAMAEAEHETAELNAKLAWAEAFAKSKEGENKVSDTLAKAQADIAVEAFRLAAIKARMQFMKLKATRDAVQEAIWAQKFLGRNGG